MPTICTRAIVDVNGADMKRALTISYEIGPRMQLLMMFMATPCAYSERPAGVRHILRTASNDTSSRTSVSRTVQNDIVAASFSNEKQCERENSEGGGVASNAKCGTNNFCTRVAWLGGGGAGEKSRVSVSMKMLR